MGEGGDTANGCSDGQSQRNARIASIGCHGTVREERRMVGQE